MCRGFTFSIVLAVAGAPATALACDMWCATPAARDHHRLVGCHDVFNGQAENRQIIAGSAECHDAVSAAPFVAEVRSDVPTPVAADVPLLSLLESVSNRRRPDPITHSQRP
jgi:hypothetical protein